MTTGYSLKELADILKAKLIGDPNRFVNEYAIDTRRISIPDRTLFFAISTERADGHFFISNAFSRGLCCAVVQREMAIPGLNQLVVDDVVQALQKLAAFHRSKFDIPVIGITGSNGKTMVKEWLNQICSAQFNICRSPRSFNSQLGVALSLLQLNAQHQLAIIEAGISMPGEMDALFQMIQPTLGVFTHLGQAHLSNFSDQSSLLNEKMKLFQNAIPVVAPWRIGSFENAFYWGDNSECTWKVEWLKSTRHNQASVNWEGHSFQLSFPFESSVECYNAMTAVAVALKVGVSKEQVIEKVQSLSTLDMRMEQIDGVDESTLINDAYSFDLSSLQMAMRDAWNIQPHRPHVLILSDLPIHDDVAYREVLSAIVAFKWARIVLIGKRWVDFHPKGAEVFLDIEEFLKEAEKASWFRSVVLVKGSRESRFENIVLRLQAKNHVTNLEIDLEAIQNNLNHYRSLIKPEVKMMVMLKADAYGLGAVAIAQALNFQQVDYIGVAYVDEGIALRNAGVSVPIMVMNPEQQSVKALLDYNLEPEVYSLTSFQHLLKQKDALENDKNLSVHLKVDTGMRRLGIEPNDWDQFEILLKGRADITLVSILTHLAASEDQSHDEFTRNQIQRFGEVVLKAKSVNPNIIVHAANSAGIERWGSSHLGMVRLGIGLYGVSSVDDHKKSLSTTCSWNTHISQVKFLQKGESIGYGRSEYAKENMTLAILPVGYADGFPRVLSNGKGSVFVGGKLCPIVGRVCMDMVMIDVTGLNVQDGDHVEIFGNNIKVEEFASWCGTISYEILTGISNRVKRIYIKQ